MGKISVNTLKKEDIEKELKRINYNSQYRNILRNTIYVLIVIAALGTLIASFIMPVLQVNTNSMNSLYKSGDIVLTLKTSNIKTGDVIAYYHGNKILISRVIGVGTNLVDIDEDGNVKLNGQLLNEEYVSNKDYVLNDNTYPLVVESEKYFVLNDDREDTTDSRDKEIGNISKSDLVGKVILKVWSK